MQHITYVDCESENTTNIATFLTLVNKILCEVKGDSDYVWNPQAIMTDKSATNKIRVGQVLGEDMQKKRCVMSVALSEMCKEAKP